MLSRKFIDYDHIFYMRKHVSRRIWMYNFMILALYKTHKEIKIYEIYKNKFCHDQFSYHSKIKNVNYLVNTWIIKLNLSNIFFKNRSHAVLLKHRGDLLTVQMALNFFPLLFTAESQHNTKKELKPSQKYTLRKIIKINSFFFVSPPKNIC